MNEIGEVVDKLIRLLIVDDLQEIIFNKESLRKLPLIFPSIFHKACYYLDLKSINVLAVDDEIFIYVRDKILLTNDENDEINDLQISQNYKETNMINIVDLTNFTCQCSTYQDSLTNTPPPICEHLLCCYIWWLNKLKLLSYINFTNLEMAEWITQVDKLTKLSITQ